MKKLSTALLCTVLALACGCSAEQKEDPAAEGKFLRFVRRVSPGTQITPELILPMIHELEKEGYTLKGDMFLFLVMGNATYQTQDLSSFEFEVE